MDLTPVTAVGLAVALVGFGLLDRIRRAAAGASDRGSDGGPGRPVGERGDAPHPPTDLREHAWKWAIPIVLLAVVALEGNSPASIGWRVESAATFVGRVGIGFFVLTGLNVVSAPLWSRVGDGGDSLAAGLGSFAPLSIPERLFVAFTAGATEETAFHGYAFERLLALTGSAPLSAGVTFLAFTLGHAGDTWDRDAVLRIAQPALVMTLLYLWFRSLPVLIAVHALNDAAGLLLADRLADRADGKCDYADADSNRPTTERGDGAGSGSADSTDAADPSDSPSLGWLGDE